MYMLSNIATNYKVEANNLKNLLAGKSFDSLSAGCI